MKKIICLIPARGGSKGIPDKNIYSLGNHPLIAYTIAVAKLSKHIEEIYVTTDSEKIATIAKKYNAFVPFLRPESISHDQSMDKDFFEHFNNYTLNSNPPLPELIVHLRPTSPFRLVEEVDLAIEYMLIHNEMDSLRSMHKVHVSPYKMFRKDGKLAKPFFDNFKQEKEFYNLPRQAFERTYQPNGHVDVVKPKVLLKSGLLHGEKMKLWETDKIPDIDVIEDIEFAKQCLNLKKYRLQMDYLKENHE